MPDIFDSLTAEKPSKRRDVFDDVELEALPAPKAQKPVDVFDEVQPEPAKQVEPSKSFPLSGAYDFLTGKGRPEGIPGVNAPEIHKPVVLQRGFNPLKPVKEAAEFSYSPLASGAAQFNASLARTPNLIYNLAAAPINMARRAVGLPDIQDPKIFEGAAKFWDEKAAEYNKGAERWGDKGLVDVAKTSGAPETAKYLAYKVLENLPQQVFNIGAASSGASGFGLAMAGLSSGAQELKEARDKGADQVKASLDAALNGTLEAGFESLGTFGLLHKWGDALKDSFGTKGVVDISKDIMKTLFHTTLGEANEEFWTSLGQDFSRVITGVDKNAMNGALNRAIEAGAIGGASGLTSTAPTAIAQGASSAANVNVRSAGGNQVAEEQKPKFEGPIKDKSTFKEYLKAAAPQISDEEVEGAASLIDSRADAWARETGGTKQQYYESRIADIRQGEEAVAPETAQGQGSPSGQALPLPATSPQGQSVQEGRESQTKATGSAAMPVHAAYRGQAPLYSAPSVPFADSITSNVNYNKLFSDADAVVRNYAKTRNIPATPEFAAALGQEIHDDFKAVSLAQSPEEKAKLAQFNKEKYPDLMDAVNTYPLLRNLNQVYLLDKVGDHKNAEYLMGVMVKRYSDATRPKAGIEAEKLPPSKLYQSWSEDPKLKEGPPRAEFAYWQLGHGFDVDKPYYNIRGQHPKTGSSVTGKTLESLGIQVPPTPTIEEWKKAPKYLKQDQKKGGDVFRRIVEGQKVDGRDVLDNIPNTSSIESSLEDYEVLPGIREVPFSAFTMMGDLKYYSADEEARTKRLAEKIKHSGEISPLIVVMDDKGPYILEGAHRFDALRELGAKSFPALVVNDNENIGVAKLNQSSPKNQTETPEFKKWFGDSKVVDENGKPLVVYHGTNASFTEFDKGKMGQTDSGWYGRGFYFTPDKNFRFAEDAVRNRGGSASVMPVYLKIENPAYGLAHAEQGSDLVSSAKERGKDGLIIRYDSGHEKAGQIAEIIAFYPTQIKSATGNSGAFDPKNPNILNQPAYHGSPHKFDKFSLQKIGTGEGAAAYGWGLYFAGNKDVAQFYKDKLGQTPVFSIKKQDGSWFKADKEQNDSMVHAASLVFDVGQKEAKRLAAQWVEEAKSKGSKESGEPREGYYQEIKGYVDQLKKSDIKREFTGHLYKVDIPEDDQYLQWDKPFSEQSATVQKAVTSAAGALAGTKYDAYEQLALAKIRGEHPRGAKGYDPTGQEIYQDLSDLYGPESASKLLSRNGAAGIRYPDEGSRGKVEVGTYNYVVFDDKLVKIMEMEQRKNGETPKGSVEFLDDGRAIIRAFKSADFSTVVHELGHIFRRDLTDKQLKAAEDWAGVKDGKWTVEAEEKFARGFERYIYEGEAPTLALKSIFEKFKRWMTDVYKSLTGSDIDVQISPEIKTVFENLIAGNRLTRPKEFRVGERGYIAIADLDAIRGFIRKYFTTDKGVGPVIDQANRDRVGRIMERVFDAPLTGKVLKEYFKKNANNGDLKESVFNALTGKVPMDSLPKEIQPTVKQMRSDVDSLSRLVKEYGTDSDSVKAVIESNLGRYLGRYYRLFEGNKDRAYKPSKEVIEAAKKKLQEMHPRSLGVLTNEQMDGVIKNILDRRNTTFQKGDKTINVSQNHFIKRKNIPAEIRALYGEVTDPVYAYLKTVADMSTIAHNGMFLEKISQVPNAFLDQPTESHYKKLPDTKSWGAVKGKYTTEEIYEFLIDNLDPVKPSWMSRFIEKAIVNPFKATKTVYSVPGYPRNFMGNFAFAQLAGNSITNPANIPYYSKAAQIMATKEGKSRETWKELVRNKVVGQQYYGSEMPRLMNEFLEDPASFSEEVGRKIGRGMDFFGNLYNSMDVIFRVSSYLKYKDQGLNETEAANKVNRYFTDYENIPRAGQFMRKYAVLGPFFSFKAETMRIFKNAAEDAFQGLKQGNPAPAMRLALVLGTVATIGKVFSKLFHVDDDEKKKLEQVLPDYRRHSGMVYYRDGSGKLKAFDLTYIWPTGDFDRAARALMAGDRTAFYNSVDLFSHPIFDFYSILMQNRDPYRNEAVSSELDPFSRQLEERGKALLRSVYLPASSPIPDIDALTKEGRLKPGLLTGYQIKNLIDAYNGVSDKWGRVKNLPEEVKNFLTGIRTWDVRPDILIQNYQRDLKRQMVDEQMDFRKWMKNNSRQASKAEIEDRKADFMRRMRRIKEDSDKAKQINVDVLENK